MIKDTMSLGELMPKFNLLNINSEFVDSESLKKIKLIIFACNHCPYVKAYLNRIVEIANKYNNHVDTVLINSNDDKKYPEDSFEKMKELSEEYQFEFPYLRDETQETARKFRATHTPEVFLFNKENKLIYKGKIDDNWRNENEVKSKYLEDAIIETIEGKEVSMPETFSIGCTIKWKDD